MQNPFIKKEMLIAIRIIALICASFLIEVELLNQLDEPFISENSSINFSSFTRLIGNSSVIISFILLFIFPQKLELLAIVSFYYTFICTIFDLDNPIGICMFYLGISVLYVRGFFINNKKQKIVIIIFISLLVLLCGLHFGLSAFFDALLNKVAYFLVISITFFLILSYKHSIDSNQIQILNLSEYPELVETDVVLLEKVLENKPYKIIAMEVLRAEGTVRNRLNKIYHTLGVIDRMGFISTYFGYEIIFKKEDVTSKDINDNNLPEQSLA